MCEFHVGFPFTASLTLPTKFSTACLALPAQTFAEAKSAPEKFRKIMLRGIPGDRPLGTLGDQFGQKLTKVSVFASKSRRQRTLARILR
jgi:hypothetical protein